MMKPKLVQTRTLEQPMQPTFHYQSPPSCSLFPSSPSKCSPTCLQIKWPATLILFYFILPPFSCMHLPLSSLNLNA
ncbi:hypothetical protein KSP39_PZI018774 [Platanthera zijinensis]|uniref:Uncharacterized protein n=1 Tax=Platanthera zijinensis TaxID=2320716 RepID=A0AAP0B3I8_9ASPA